MAEKYQQVHPLAPVNNFPRSDEESATLQSRELKKKQRLKCLVYIAAFVVFQTIIIVVFALTVMRIKTPKVRYGTVTVDNSVNGNIRLTTQVMVKNNNFGHYKFDSSILTVTAGDVTVGSSVIPDGRARARSTKKYYVIVDLDSSSLQSNADSGVVLLTSQAMVRGKVEIMKVLKKKKSADMSCTMSFDLSTNIVQNVNCK